MKDQIADHAKDWLTLALTGLGITFAPHEYIGGMFLALAGGALAARYQPEADRRELWLVLLAAFFASHLAAMASAIYLPALPPQIPMALAGFGSRFIVRIALEVGGAIETKSDTIADKIIDKVLPGRDDK